MSISFSLAILAAVGCAICNGLAAILQKISADKVSMSSSANSGLMRRVLGDGPFIIGGALDITAWILTLIAVHYLPLFVVQPIIAFSVVVTVIVESFVFHRRIIRISIAAIGCIAIGLIIVAVSAAPEFATAVSPSIRLAILLTPIFLGLLGLLIVVFIHRLSNTNSAICLAILSGISFGGTAIAGRLLVFNQPYWHVVYNPLFVSILAYGAVGISLFTYALQRQHASIVNAVMIAFETIVPITVGIVLLGDKPKQGYALVLGLGILLALFGTFKIAKSSPVVT